MRLFLMLALAITSFCSRAQPETEFVVAKDGKGDYTSIQAAINATKAFPDYDITIHIKEGVYHEKVTVYEWNTRLSLIGQSAEKTVITWNDYFDKINLGRNSTFHTATVQVDADDFTARNLTIENTAGEVGQALALAVNGNRAVFDGVRLLGNQDTLYVTGEGNKQYFKNCYIEGTTDFIFGSATAVFEGCEIHSLSDSYITAASTPATIASGFVFWGGKLTAAKGVDEVYLGRPWRNHAKTVFINTWVGPHILKAGWHDWNKPHAHSTTFYAELGSHGPGASGKTRVKWAHILNEHDKSRWQPAHVLYSESHPGWYLR